MSRERNQKLRTLESQYLKLRWKICKYEKYIEFTARDKSQLMVDRLKTKLAAFREEQGEVWDMIVLLHKD